VSSFYVGGGGVGAHLSLTTRATPLFPYGKKDFKLIRQR
jgi:hypothetical protein